MKRGFIVLCGQDGVVTSAFGEGAVTAGTQLSTIVARDSRERLLHLLADSRQSDQQTILQMADGTTLEVRSATGEGQTLVVAAATVTGIRARCETVDGDAVAGPLAQRISESSAPDELTIDLWSELSRVNNDLATAQRQLAKNNAELRWLNEQKNQLLGMAAHDLRNPLAVVLAYSQFMSSEAGELTTQHRDMLKRIEANAETMLGMVEEVLDFSAIESGTVRLDPVEFSLSGLITDIAQVNTLIAEPKDIRIASSVDPGLPLVRADKRKLMQVLNNLITNAIKFSHRGSSVTIAAGPDQDGAVWISVTDRGVGMTPEQTARLFKPFGRVGVEATGGEKSTGLGLAIVKRIVEAHGGHVEVESTPGVGTTFTVVLPVAGDR